MIITTCSKYRYAKVFVPLNGLETCNSCKSYMKALSFWRNHASILFCFDFFLKKKKKQKSLLDALIEVRELNWCHSRFTTIVLRKPPSLTGITVRGSTISQWQISVKHACVGVSHAIPAVGPRPFGQRKNLPSRSRAGAEQYGEHLDSTKPYLC